ncbi:MAG: 5-formyltetrahydrofolate cyclo-ligase [Sphaerochaetaceae bacterium]|jgi:5-formyltetrahydrofolate cyclo-ligase|nr:5-formyltetrahydrofolate cyclo-ligase [Sphaerochaetaceae bacterium]
MNIPEDKQRLRKEMRKILQTLSLEERAKESQRIVKNIVALPLLARSSTILGFIPMQSEPDLGPLYDGALAQGKKVAFPCCSNNGQMVYHLVDQDWRKHLVRSPYGNLEPNKDKYSPIYLPILETSMLLVPGLAFSPMRQRLGRSMGVFDRFLAHKDLNCFSIGVCFALQIRKTIPLEPHDFTLDLVVTESQTY